MPGINKFYLQKLALEGRESKVDMPQWFVIMEIWGEGNHK